MSDDRNLSDITSAERFYVLRTDATLGIEAGDLIEVSGQNSEYPEIEVIEQRAMPRDARRWWIRRLRSLGKDTMLLKAEYTEPLAADGDS